MPVQGLEFKLYVGRSVLVRVGACKILIIRRSISIGYTSWGICANNCLGLFGPGRERLVSFCPWQICSVNNSCQGAGINVYRGVNWVKVATAVYTYSVCSECVFRVCIYSVCSECVYIPSVCILCVYIFCVF